MLKSQLVLDIAAFVLNVMNRTSIVDLLFNLKVWRSWDPVTGDSYLLS